MVLVYWSIWNSSFRGSQDPRTPRPRPSGRGTQNLQKLSFSYSFSTIFWTIFFSFWGHPLIRFGIDFASFVGALWCNNIHIYNTFRISVRRVSGALLTLLLGARGCLSAVFRPIHEPRWEDFFFWKINKNHHLLMVFAIPKAAFWSVVNCFFLPCMGARGQNLQKTLFLGGSFWHHFRVPKGGSYKVAFFMKNDSF